MNRQSNKIKPSESDSSSPVRDTPHTTDSGGFSFPKKNPIHFSKETEAAWYVLKPFVDCFNFGKKVFIDGKWTPISCNKSELLEHLFNEKKLSIDTEYGPRRVSFFSKKNLDSHLNGFDTYYYRSSSNTIRYTGYGVSDKTACKLPFSAELGITTKKVSIQNEKVMLIGIDIDCHNGEKDSSKWLPILSSLFGDFYYEPSTSGSGLHGYVKLSCPIRYSTSYIIDILCTINNRLKDSGVALGIKSSLDSFKGTPSRTVKNESGKIVYSNRGNLLKIPRLTTMDKIKSFYSKPYVLFTNLEHMIELENRVMREEVGEDSYYTYEHTNTVDICFTSSKVEHIKVLHETGEDTWKCLNSISIQLIQKNRSISNEDILSFLYKEGIVKEEQEMIRHIERARYFVLNKMKKRYSFDNWNKENDSLSKEIEKEDIEKKYRKGNKVLNLKTELIAQCLYVAREIARQNGGKPVQLASSFLRDRIIEIGGKKLNRSQYTAIIEFLIAAKKIEEAGTVKGRVIEGEKGRRSGLFNVK